MKTALDLELHNWEEEQQNTMLKKGDKIKIYASPITQEKFEGEAMLVKQTNKPDPYKYDGVNCVMHFWDVHFPDDDRGCNVSRRIRTLVLSTMDKKLKIYSDYLNEKKRVGKHAATRKLSVLYKLPHYAVLKLVETCEAYLEG